MASHYSLLLRMPLSPERAVANTDVLHFLFNPQAGRPSALPDHEFFRSRNATCRFHDGYRHLAPGSWASSFWQETAEDGSCRYAGVSLCLPGLKLEGVFQHIFLLAQWLASMSDAEGPVGVVAAEDLPTSKPMVLYVRGRRFFVGDSEPGKAYAIDDGAPYFGEA